MSAELRAGHTVHARTLGTGARRGLMLHCSLAHGGAWRGLAGQFEDQFSFVAPDLLGHGRSAAWNGQGCFHQACSAVAQSFLGEEPVDIVGHSFGATLALRLALEAPGAVRSLVLFEPVFFAVALADDPHFVNDMNGLDLMIAAGKRREATKAFLSAWGGGLPWEAMPKEVQDDMAARIHVINDAALALYQDTAGLLREGRLQALEIPVFLVRGSQSDPVIETINEGLARRIPGAKTAVLEGAGHMLPISHPKDCAALLRGFWQL